MGPLTLAAIGGVLTLDETSVGQFMVSQPLVAGAVTGWLVGQPEVGITAGLILQLFYMARFRVGAARFPEGGSAAMTAAVTGAAIPEPSGLALGVCAGLVIGELGGATVSILRRINTRLAPDGSLGSLRPAEVERFHLLAIGCDFVRGFLVTLLGVSAGPLLATLLAPRWPLDSTETLALLLLVAAAPLGVSWRSLGRGGSQTVLLAVGVVLGLVVGVLT
jgi:PTS system mannose-specific IIC component